MFVQLAEKLGKQAWDGVERIIDILVQGGLAQVMRATGEVEREAAIWQALLTTDFDDPQLQLHVLDGAASSALHRGQPGEAMAACDGAIAALQASEPAVAARWMATFHLHQALAILCSGGDSSRMSRVDGCDSREGLELTDEAELQSIGIRRWKLQKALCDAAAEAGIKVTFAKRTERVARPTRPAWTAVPARAKSRVWPSRSN